MEWKEESGTLKPILGLVNWAVRLPDCLGGISRVWDTIRGKIRVKTEHVHNSPASPEEKKH
jgi:hypothetical protein